MHGRVVEAGVPPEDFAGKIEASRPLMTEMHIQPPAMNHRRWTGMAVLAVNARRQRAFLLKDIRRPKNLAGLRVQTQCLKRLIVFRTVLRDTGSQVNAPCSHDRRRPTFPRDALLP